MAFTKTTSIVDLLSNQSAKILNTFTKTKEDLLALNSTIFESKRKNDEKIAELQAQNENLAELKNRHDSVILNINKFLGTV